MSRLARSVQAAVLFFITLSSMVLAPQARAADPAPQTLFELEFPTGIAFGYGKMFVNERAGRVRVIERGELLPEPLATIPTDSAAENGLFGIAVSPDAGDRAVYVFATTPDGAQNDVWRVPIDGGEPVKVVEGLPAGGYHNGGGVAFDLDGMLLVSNGESHEMTLAQDPDVLGGKIYRFNPDGTIPADNPWPDSPAMSIGHRNPFGLAVDPVSGDAWVTENGPDSFDEINHIVPGGNGGWPIVSGPGCEDAPEIECADPVLSYEEVIVPTGITFAPDTAPRRYRGHMFFGAYGDGTIHDVTLDDSRSEATSDEVLLQEEEPVVALAWGPEGLYYSTTEAVKLLPFSDGSSGSGATGAGEPSPSPSPAAADEDEDATGLLVVVLVFLALYAASRRRLFR